MIGSGVFMLPASLAPYGWGAVAGWVATIAGSLCLAAVLAGLARNRPGAAPHACVAEGFGPLPAFLVAWSYWLSAWVTNATIAVAATSYLARFWPVLSHEPLAGGLVSVGLVWLFTLVALGGPRSAGRVQVATTLIKLLPLIGAVLLAGWLLTTGRAALPAPTAAELSAPAISAAATLTLWAMLGFESAAIPAGRVRDPARTIPLATLWGTALTGAFYLLACSAVMFLAGDVEAPFAVFFARFMGPAAGDVVAALAIVAALGALNGWIFIQGELPQALARAGVFPRWFAPDNAAGTPARALVLSSALASILVVANQAGSLRALFTFMALLATVYTLLLYLLVALTAWRLRAAPRALAGLGALYALWTFWSAGAEATAWGAAGIAAGLPVYLAMRRRSAEQAP